MLLYVVPYGMFSGNTEVGFSEFPVVFIIRNTLQDGVEGRKLRGTLTTLSRQSNMAALHINHQSGMA